MDSVSDRVSSGVPDVDELLGGLILGDNVVWVVEDTEVVRHLEDALVREVLSRGEACFYVSAGADPDRLRTRFGPGVTILDARPRGPHGDAAALETAIIEGASNNPPGYVVIDGLVRFGRPVGVAQGGHLLQPRLPPPVRLGGGGLLASSAHRAGSVVYRAGDERDPVRAGGGQRPFSGSQGGGPAGRVAGPRAPTGSRRRHHPPRHPEVVVDAEAGAYWR